MGSPENAALVIQAMHPGKKRLVFVIEDRVDALELNRAQLTEAQRVDDLVGKDIENRPRRSHYRGPLLIHASAAKPDASALEALGSYLARIHGDAIKMPSSFPTGELVGVVDMVDCVDNASSPWAEKDLFHLVLRNPRSVRSGLQLSGQLGIWKWTVGTVSTGWRRKDVD